MPRPREFAAAFAVFAPFVLFVLFAGPAPADGTKIVTKEEAQARKGGEAR